MWPRQRIKGHFPAFYCPECAGDLYFESPSVDFIQKCKNCHEFNGSRFYCKKTTCKFQLVICTACYLEQLDSKILKSERIGESQMINNITIPNRSLSYFIFITGAGLLITLLVSLLFYFTYTSGTQGSVDLDIMDKLRKDYPSQKNETWYHFMSVLEGKIPTVKSVVLLHGEDEKTSESLINDLVFLYTRNYSIKREEITFSSIDYEIKDYGIVLEHYRQIVKTFRILITDLNKVTGNIASVFHSLCDEISSDMKPSLFIFTLKFDERTENLKPVQRANTVLKEAWNDLPENEIFPLLSRIVKNVVDIIPEK